MTVATTFDALLRDRASLYSRLDRGEGLAELARALVIICAASAAVFGAAVGAYRGGVQIAFAAIKVPAVLLLTAAICAPGWTAFRLALGRCAVLRVELVRVLAGLAMVGLVLAALAPAFLLGVALEASYHAMAIGLCGCAVLAGIAGVFALVRSRVEQAAFGALVPFLAIFVVVGAQMSWTLRPYLVRPRAPEVEFVRSLEGSIVEAAHRSWKSANGEYLRDSAPLPGEAGSVTWE